MAVVPLPFFSLQIGGDSLEFKSWRASPRPDLHPRRTAPADRTSEPDGEPDEEHPWQTPAVCGVAVVSEPNEPVEDAPVDAGHDDAEVVAALVRGDEATFVALVDRYHASMVRVASRFVPNQAIAEEVTQEAWVGLLRGIGGFSGRSSLKTWLFTILLNQARRRGAAEHRTAPFSSFDDDHDEWNSATVPPERFFPPGHPDAGHWAGELADWAPSAEDALMSTEVDAVIRAAINRLPAGIAVVITLRDLEGWDATEVCNVLGISDTNQRVRLHRARARVRAELEQYLEEE
jgi:RNA polymerase sigma-70 factor, ECF subfamily